MFSPLSSLRGPDPNLFEKSTLLPCQGARCTGTIMHQRYLYDEPFNAATDTFGPRRTPRSYADRYYCSEGCGIRYEKPKNYDPPKEGDLVAQADAKLAEELERRLAQEAEQPGDTPKDAQ